MGVGNQCSNSDRRGQPQLEREIAEEVVDNIVEGPSQVYWRLSSAGPGKVATGSIPEAVVQKIQNLLSGTKAVCLAQALLNLTRAAAVGNSSEIPVQIFLPKNVVPVEEVERNRNLEPLLSKNDLAEVEEHKSAVLGTPVSDPVSDPDSNTADSPAIRRQCGSPPAGLLAEGAHFRAGGSL